MPDTDKLYDIFIIYHPSDIEFVRRVDAHMKANGMLCWVSWEDLSNAIDGQAVLKSGILRSHTVAIALSPKSAESPICNTLIQFAVQNSKRFVTLIVDENIEIDVHPAIAENPYIYFRAQDEMEQGISDLLDMMDVDDHILMHTQLLVYANDWDGRNRNRGLLLPLDQVNEARDWLAEGAHRQPKPSELQVEYIHASRRQKSTRRRGLSIYLLMALIIVILIGAVLTLLQSAQDSQSLADSRSTEAAIQVATGEANAQIADTIAGSATAEAVIVEDFSQTATSALALAQMAVDSASTADVLQQTAQSQSNTAINQASTALTAQAEAENLLIIAETESDTSSTLQSQVLTAEFESVRLVETAQSAQSASLNIALTATAVMQSAGNQSNVALTQVANLATAEFNATQQLATGTAVQLLSDSNASTALAFAQIAEEEAEGRSTAEAQLQSITDTATQTFETALEINSQSLILSAEQALNAGDVDLAMTLALTASQYVQDSTQIYRILSRAADLSPSLVLPDVSLIKFNPTSDEFALLPRSFDRVQIYDTSTRQIKFELTEHNDLISAIEYSLDGQFIVTGAQDGEVIIWSASTGTPLHRLNRHQGVVGEITMHPDGERLITAGIRPMLILWNINTGEEIANYIPERRDEFLPNDMIVSADGTRIVGWSDSRGATVMGQWTSDNLELLTSDTNGRVYRGYDSSHIIAWTGGRALPAYADDPNVGELVLWDINSGQQQLRLTEDFYWTVLNGDDIASSTDSALFVAFTDNGDTALLGIQSSDGGQRAVLLNTTDGTIQRTYQSNIATQITSAQFIDESTILSTTRDNHLVLWSTNDGGLIRDIGMSTRALQDVHISPDDNIALVNTSNGEVYLWSLAETSPTLAQVIPNAVTGTAINQTGDRLLVASNSGAVLQNTNTQQAVVTLDTTSITRMNSSRTHFATVSDDNILLYDARTGIEQKSWSVSFADNIIGLTLSSSGNQLVVETDTDDMWLLRIDADGAFPLRADDVSPPFAVQFNHTASALITLHPESAILWETATTSEIQRFPLGLPPDIGLEQRVQMAFSKDNTGVTFFVQLDNNIAGLTGFDLNSSEVNRQTFVDVVRGQFSEDGAYLLLALTDNSVQIIDIASAEVTRRLIGHTDAVQIMIYQPDNNLLYSGSNDHTLIRWDVDSGTIAHQYRHPADVISLTVSQDGERALSLAEDGVYRLWQPETLQDLMERIQSRFTLRDLTCTEREQYNILPLCT